MPIVKRKETKELEIPTDSVSDIAFLLIIFFILTTTLSKLSGFTAELPSADASQKQAAKTDAKTPSVQLAGGKLLFNEQEVSLQTLQDRLLDLRLGSKDGEEKVVLLEAGGKVEYQTYYAAMAAISTAGGVVAIVEEE
ncbi:MAG: biopolymer transporter ExbD [Planctomycetota bacterium]|jgi:biopolymer transport protein ExbD|nr:biopolymer transporter ExbD [Planctomycetia bacterium]